MNDSFTPMPLNVGDLRSIASSLEAYGTSPLEFLTSLSLDTKLEHLDGVQQLRDNIGELLDVWYKDPRTRESTLEWAHKAVKLALADEVCKLTSKKNGWHFSAAHATQTRLEQFDVAMMASNIGLLAPGLWNLVEVLLSANSTLSRRRKGTQGRRKKEEGLISRGAWPVHVDNPDADVEMGPPTDVDNAGRAEHHQDDDDELYWRDEGDDSEALPPLQVDSNEADEEMYWEGDADGDTLYASLDGDGNPIAAEEATANGSDAREQERIGILTMSTNVRCNAMQSMTGIFLHSCNAPEAVIDLLSRIGISISHSTIDSAVTSLSREAGKEIKSLGSTLLASYAYDNFDVEMKQSVPTVDNIHENLLHLTSGTLLRLDHSVTRDDLRCSKELWDKSLDNPANHQLSRGTAWTKLLTIHPEILSDSSIELTRRQRFNAWKFMHDLISHGPEYFRRFAKDLGTPETIDQIPLVKSRQVPAEGMDINESTIQGNADALDSLFKQGGIGDAREAPGVTDIGDHVVLVHGDLSTCERVQSLQVSRAEEETALRRYQCVIFINGYFHLKMACGDAIWKILIFPKPSREDDTSLMKQVGQIRPKEMVKIGSKPGFRRMHEVISHVGIVSRLDCWTEEVRRRDPRHRSLTAWGETEPTWAMVRDVATTLVRNYLPDDEFSGMHYQSPESRDEKHENTLLKEQYFLLYEEMSYAMNAGDIGRVETCLMPWIFIFKGCGKHNRAIRMNILCNPTGKLHHFRAIDWWVEHNNLYIKVSLLLSIQVDIDPLPENLWWRIFEPYQSPHLEGVGAD
ncbi:hypothetical protein B0H21DRAFT_801792 [Amylocystis lapponica]|nr:hypothetical protein B0H21DRAFT_801792 [Amylocystis lapponica]